MRLPVGIHFTIREPIRILDIIYWIEVAENFFLNFAVWIVLNCSLLIKRILKPASTFYIDRMSHF